MEIIRDQADATEPFEFNKDISTLHCDIGRCNVACGQLKVFEYLWVKLHWEKTTRHVYIRDTWLERFMKWAMPELWNGSQAVKARQGRTNRTQGVYWPYVYIRRTEVCDQDDLAYFVQADTII